jgi:23S rRNA pseudouridine1911/1915/1917 synthase
MEPPRVIYEAPDFLIVSKPAGLLVHPKSLEIQGEDTLVKWLCSKYPEIKEVGDEPLLRPGLVHRLDKGTSGILLVARTKKGFDYFKGLFKERKIEKKYLAVVSGEFSEKHGTIQKPIGMGSGSLKRTTRGHRFVKDAYTEYSVLKIGTYLDVKGKENYFSLLEVIPRTGRTHQIRVHLASIGHPLVGDTLYGTKVQPTWSHRLMLHAFSLEFTTEEGERIKVEAEPPDDFMPPLLWHKLPL